ADPKTQRQIVYCHQVLGIDCLLLNIRVAAKCKQMSAARQVERSETRYEALACWIIERRIRYPELKAFGQERVLNLRANLYIMNASVVSNICFDTEIVEPARLRNCLGLIGEGVGAWQVLDHIKSVKGIDGQQQRRAERMHVTRRDVDRVNELTLVLPESFLVKGVGYLKEVSSEIHIQVQRVVGSGAIVKPVKDRGGLASIMEGSKFGWIEKAARTLEIECSKIAGPLVPKAEGGLLLRRAERAVHSGQAPERPRDAESRFGDGVDYQACLVSVFRGRPSSYDFQ